MRNHKKKRINPLITCGSITIVIVIYLFRGILFSTEESGTDSEQYGSHVVDSLLFQPAECDQTNNSLKDTNVFAIDTKFIEELDWIDRDEKCDCNSLRDSSDGPKLVVNNFKDSFEPYLVEKREEIFEKYRKQNWNLYKKEEIAFCNPKNPLNYPITPQVVRPKMAINIPNVSLDDSIIGNVNLDFGVKHGLVTIIQNGKTVKAKKIEAISCQSANEILRSLKYHAVMYDARPYSDEIKIQITLENENSKFQKISSAKIPIKVEKHIIPALPVFHGDGVEDKITIVIKTYLRYKCVRHLIYSIRKFYPKITILVADDTDIDERRSLDDLDNVFQFYMPSKYGWFAGRNLLVSQVKTEYYIWCDDDFVFHDKTNLTYLLDKIDRSGYDVVGGGVNSDKRCEWNERQKLITDFDSEGGFCVKRQFGSYGSWEDCQVGDNLLNFFIARTETSGTIRFNPNYDKFAHMQYFLAAQTHLRMMVCPKSWIGHRKDLCIDRNVLSYGNERKATPQKFKENDYRWYFSQYMKCTLDLH